MTGDYEDQLSAAVTDARKTFNNALGLPNDHRPDKGNSPLLAEILDRYSTPQTGRCAHLQARPMQPWFLVLPFETWRCRPCLVAFTSQTPRPRADDIEEHTCDRCRRYLPSTRFVTAVMRQDIWTVIANLCPRCEVKGRSQGLRDLQ